MFILIQQYGGAGCLKREKCSMDLRFNVPLTNGVGNADVSRGRGYVNADGCWQVGEGDKKAK